MTKMSEEEIAPAAVSTISNENEMEMRNMRNIGKSFIILIFFEHNFLTVI